MEDELAADDSDVTASGAQVVVYSEDGWNELAEAFRADKAAGATFFMHIPALANEKTVPRGPHEPANMRARGPQFRALAEFHWGGWAQVGGSWYDKGVEFRRRMAAKGYDVRAGDGWAINELPSTTRHDAATRQHVREAVRGLYDGPAGSGKAQGAVFVVGVGSSMTNFSVYKPAMEGWLADAAFWQTMSGRVRFWGQETYTDPQTACVGGTVVAARSDAINDFIQHVPRLAQAGGARAAAARAFLGRTYLPLMNGAFRSAAYQTEGMSLDQMRHFVSNQIYAARAWGGPGKRVGLGWTWRRDAAGAEEIRLLARRVASAVRGAYDDGGGAAAGACSPSRAYTWCQCTVPGARFNPGWKTFASW
jgi:hypothetical protein